MKRIALLLIFCLVLAPVCFAESPSTETSSAKRFLSNLSDTWSSFMDMVGEAGDSVSQWAEESGVADWARETAGDISAWATENGLTDWATDALGEVKAWFDASGIADWAAGTSGQIQAFIEENRPTLEAWLDKAGQEVRHAWDTLVNADQHSEEEVEQAYETVTEALEEMAEEP